MKKLLIILSVVIIISIVSLRLFLKKSDSIVVGVVSDYPPFAFRDIDSDSLSGFDIDMVKAISKRMNSEIEFRVLSFPECLDALKNNEIDVIVSGVPVSYIKSLRLENTLKYIPYEMLLIANNDCLVYHKSSETEKTPITFSSIGVQEGTIDEYRSISNKDTISYPRHSYELKKGDSLNYLMNSLRKSEIDAIYMTYSKFLYIDTLKPNSFKCNKVENVHPNANSSVINCGIIFSKRDKVLYKKFAIALKDIQDSGEYDVIKMLWVTGYSDSYDD